MTAVLLAEGCTTPNVAKIPEPPPIEMLMIQNAGIEYYPDASRRASEEGEVVAFLTIGANGVPEEPIDVDWTRTDT